MKIVLSHKIREQWNDYLDRNKEYEFDELLVILQESKEIVPAPDYVLEGCRAFRHDDIPSKLFIAKNLDDKDVLFTAIIGERSPGKTYNKKAKITLEDLHKQGEELKQLMMSHLVSSQINFQKMK